MGSINDVSFFIQKIAVTQGIVIVIPAYSLEENL